MTDLSPFQEHIFNYICRFKKQNGFTPTYSDIAHYFGFSSTATVRTYLEYLEEKGYIKRTGKTHGLQILRYTEPSSIPILKQFTSNTAFSEENIERSLDEIAELTMLQGRFAIRIQDNSLNGFGIFENDVAIIQQGEPVKDGQIGALMLNKKLTLKRVVYSKTQIQLYASIDDNKPILQTHSFFKEDFIGKVIGLVRTIT